MQSADIPRLAGKDNSDENGKAEIGGYSVILTDKNNKPVFNSEITIDKDDNISICLPKNRLLDFADRTTVTVFNTENQTAATDLNIFVADDNGNNATGVTDENGQFIAPDQKSSTGDDNGTIGKEDGDSKFTYVVRVTDKLNIVIPNCETYIGESNNIVVKLPAENMIDYANRITVTVLDKDGAPLKDISVTVSDAAEKIGYGQDGRKRKNCCAAVE